MDWTQIGAWAGGLILSIGAVTIFIKKYIGKAKKVIAIATEALNIVNDTIIAVEPDADGKITVTAQEVADITEHVKKFKEALKK